MPIASKPKKTLLDIKSDIESHNKYIYENIYKQFYDEPGSGQHFAKGEFLQKAFNHLDLAFLKPFDALDQADAKKLQIASLFIPDSEEDDQGMAENLYFYLKNKVKLDNAKEIAESLVNRNIKPGEDFLEIIEGDNDVIAWRKVKKNTKNIYQKILHDVDYLNRSRQKGYDAKKLELIKEIEHIIEDDEKEDFAEYVKSVLYLSKKAMEVGDVFLSKLSKEQRNKLADFVNLNGEEREEFLLDALEDLGVDLDDTPEIKKKNSGNKKLVTRVKPGDELVYPNGKILIDSDYVPHVFDNTATNAAITPKRNVNDLYPLKPYFDKKRPLPVKVLSGLMVGVSLGFVLTPIGGVLAFAIAAAAGLSLGIIGPTFNKYTNLSDDDVVLEHNSRHKEFEKADSRPLFSFANPAHLFVAGAFTGLATLAAMGFIGGVTWSVVGLASSIAVLTIAAIEVFSGIVSQQKDYNVMKERNYVESSDENLQEKERASAAAALKQSRATPLQSNKTVEFA